jgi:hypothetical protein
MNETQSLTACLIQICELLGIQPTLDVEIVFDELVKAGHLSKEEQQTILLTVFERGDA